MTKTWRPANKNLPRRRLRLKVPVVAERAEGAVAWEEDLAEEWEVECRPADRKGHL